MEVDSSLLCSAVEYARPVSIQGTQPRLKFKINFNIMACQLGGFDPKPVCVEFFMNKVTQEEVCLQIYSGFPCQYHSTNAP
jgi:hypothetical protein